MQLSQTAYVLSASEKHLAYLPDHIYMCGVLLKIVIMEGKSAGWQTLFAKQLEPNMCLRIETSAFLFFISRLFALRTAPMGRRTGAEACLECYVERLDQGEIKIKYG